jgi:beta-glucosidase-like glycosyl hydrolase
MCRCSYNRINGAWACENNATLGQDLKKVLGFDGFVMSDWGATHSTVQAMSAGLDMEQVAAHAAHAARTHCTHTAPTLHPHCTHTAPTLYPHCTHASSVTALLFISTAKPHAIFLGDTLIAAVKAGQVPEAAVDESVRRILSPMFEVP